MVDSNTITSALALGDLIVSSANVIISFSLLVYILTRNFRSAVARAFVALLTFMLLVYVGDVIVGNLVMPGQTLVWLRLQWFGIAFVPAAYLQFSDALLRTTGSNARYRRHGVWVAYAVALTFCLLAVFTDLVVRDGVATQWVAHLATGPLFWAFVLYFAIITLLGWRSITQARRRCLTSTSRRRMTYLSLASVAPALGVFPYILLLMTTTPQTIAPNWLYLFSLLGNACVAAMTIVMGYAVAYHGVFTPDRIVKHNMIHYLLRGPIVGIAVIALMLIIPRVESILGLPRDTVLIFTVIVGLVTFQLLVNIGKPYIDRLIYRKDRAELAWIQTLDERLFTSTDLEQLLENILTTLCDMMRVRSGFVVVMEDHTLRIRVFCGSRQQAEAFLDDLDLSDLSHLFARNNGDGNHDWPSEQDALVRHGGYWLLPLYSLDRQSTLGFMGIEAQLSQPLLGPTETQTIANLVHQAERALEDTHLQQEIFNTLRRLEPEILALQRLRVTQRYAQPGRLSTLESSPVDSPDLEKWVKDALGDLWGGPNLLSSPLLQFNIVQAALLENDGVPAKALRAVLQQAIERQRPPGQRKSAAAEWLIYNLLDLRFVQGIKTKEVARRLAVSESDFFRKQRVAIAALAQTLAEMERGTSRGDAASA